MQELRFNGQWEEWLLFMLDSIEQTAIESVQLISGLKKLMLEFKHHIRTNHPKIYSQDLINNLFKYPYTKIEFIQQDLQVSRNTSIRYLETLVADDLLVKHKIGRGNFYLNRKLFAQLKSGWNA